MQKSLQRVLSVVSQHALALLGQRIREGRLSRAMTTAELAARSGLSRSLVQRIERGEPGCAIGAVFEAAVVCGVALFEPDAPALERSLARQTEKMALLPKSVRPARETVDDNF